MHLISLNKACHYNSVKAGEVLLSPALQMKTLNDYFHCAPDGGISLELRSSLHHSMMSLCEQSASLRGVVSEEVGWGLPSLH